MEMESLYNQGKSIELFDWPNQSELNRIYIFLFLDWIRMSSITIRLGSIIIRLSSITIRLSSINIRLSSIKYLLWAN